MGKNGSESVLFCQRDIERLKEQAKVIRSEFLRKNSAPIFRGLAWAALVCAIAAIMVLAERPARQRALEATVRMERLTINLADAQTVAAETAGEISQLLRQADYDCQQLACGSILERRNRMARTQLKLAFTKSATSDEAAKTAWMVPAQSAVDGLQSAELESGPATVGASSPETVVPLNSALPAHMDNDWMKDVTALVIAPDGTWGTATEPFAGPALGKAIASCKSKYRKEIGCGYRSTLIREGWSIALRCGGQNILVAAKTLHAADHAAVNSELDLRLNYRPNMPDCVRLVSVGPDGRVIDPEAVDLLRFVGEEGGDTPSGLSRRQREENEPPTRPRAMAPLSRLMLSCGYKEGGEP